MCGMIEYSQTIGIFSGLCGLPYTVERHFRLYQMIFP